MAAHWREPAHPDGRYPSFLRTDQPRNGATAGDGVEATDDHTIGCGRPPAGVVSGRVCAGTGRQPACGVCPASPTYWRNDNPRAKALRRSMTGADQATPPARAATGVTLDWTKGGHTGRTDACVHCGKPTMLRDSAMRPSHKVCAEAAIAAGRVDPADGRLL